MNDFRVNDSVERQQFASGAVRDTRTGKGRFDLVPPEPLRRLALVYERGAEKYDDHNWKRGMPVSRYIDSALRHINSYLEGESTEDHLAMGAWNLFSAMWTEVHRPDLQDVVGRYGHGDVHPDDCPGFGEDLCDGCSGCDAPSGEASYFAMDLAGHHGPPPALLVVFDEGLHEALTESGVPHKYEPPAYLKDDAK